MDPTQADQAVQAVQAVHSTAVAVQPFVLQLIVFTKAIIMPCMFLVFIGSAILRAMIYYTIRREEHFGKEFEKRVNDFLAKDHHRGSRSFFVLAKKLLELTYYELFEMRSINKRRKLDHIMEPSDRLFLVQQGTARLVRDSLREIQFVKYDGNRPPMLEIVKSAFANNACFNRVMGLLPVGAFNDLLNTIPGLFIVAGIFGTFLGIMQALPELGAMDIRDPESTKMVMDTFLAKIAFSMSTSTVGIMLSVLMTVYNNFLSPERLFTKIVDRFERNLFRLWSRCDNNQLPEEIKDFDEHRDATEALAELSVDRELASMAGNGGFSLTTKGKKAAETPFSPAFTSAAARPASKPTAVEAPAEPVAEPTIGDDGPTLTGKTEAAQVETTDEPAATDPQTKPDQAA